MSRRLLVLALAALPLVAARPNVVLITADTLRADHLRSYGYFRTTSPAVDGLAADGWLIERAIAPMATTLPSHTSLMTSTYPLRHGIWSNLRFFHQPVSTGDSFQTAAQMFQKLGYATAAFTSATPLSAASGIAAGFDRFEGPPAYDAAQKEVEVPAHRTAQRVLAWLEEAKTPFFLWVHFFDPHDPYDPPARLRKRFSTIPALVEYLEGLGVPRDLRIQAARSTNLYDAEIFHMDRQIGRILGRLKQRGLYDDSAIVFVGDHGEGLLQHSYLRHGIVWNEQLHVPLVFKFPAGAGAPTGRSSELASLIDVLPTLAAGARLALPGEQFDGIDLISADRDTALSQREYRDPIWKEPVYALTGARWKYHRYGHSPDRLYDLEADPHELVDVIDAHPEVAKRMKAQVDELLRAQAGRSPLRAKEKLPEGVREQLKALGYVE